MYSSMYFHLYLILSELIAKSTPNRHEDLRHLIRET